MGVMKPKPQVIGRKAYIDLPVHGFKRIPAKIDTGADNSAIWASDIEEKNGVVKFKLFDKSSPHFTGETITTKDYKIISVKNSFGVSEYRYKTVLTTRLEGRDIRIRYTLADRSNTSQPVLIGRRTLLGKFMVDVSLDPDRGKKRRILFVSSKRSEKVRHLTESMESIMRDVRIERATYDDMLFTIRDGTMTVRIESLDSDLADYDIVHFKTSIQRDITAAYARYATNRGVRVLDPIVQYFPTTSKLYEYSMILDENIMVPDSVFVTPTKLVGSYAHFREQLSVPFVLKGIHASRGEINEVVKSKADFDRIAKRALKAEQYLIGQRFIPNKGDYRVLVMGKQIKLVIYRSRTDDTTHLNNTSSGSSARLVEVMELPSDIQIKCLRATALMGRDIAGVDMVQDMVTKKWYCFEVNDGPQLAGGSFITEKQRVLAEYLQRELEK